MAAFPDMKVLMDDVVERHSSAVYHWTLVGTNSGPSGTGNSVRIKGFEEWTMGALPSRRATTTKLSTPVRSSMEWKPDRTEASLHF